MKNMKLKQQSERAGNASPNSKKKETEVGGEMKQDDDEDNLITQKEFMSSIKSLKNLY